MKRWTQRTCAPLLLTSLLIIATTSSASADTAIEHATLHTISGDVIEDGTIVLDDDGTIAAVGKSGSVTIPADAARVDATGKVVTPGLIDAHTSLGLIEIWAVEASRHHTSGTEKINAAFEAAESFDPNSAVIPIQRPGGVTDVIIAPGSGVVKGWSAHVELDGDGIDFGRVVSETLAQYIQVGAGAARSLGGSRGALFGALRDLFEDVAFYQKNKKLVDEGRTRELEASPRALDALGVVIAEKKPVVFGADKASDIRWVLKFSEEQGLTPIILGGAEAWIVADELARKKVPVIANPIRNLPTGFDTLGARADNAALLHAAGAPVILSTFESHNVRRLRQVAGNAVRAGLPHDAALRAVTLGAAEAFGLQRTHGSLEKGKVANLVIWSGDPFEMATRVEAMYIRGEATSLENRQRVLLERYRQLERRAKPAPRDPEGAKQ